MTDAPKRILALDGGGIRGALSLGVLERVEEAYRERLARPDLVLRDVFDLFAGTSTGAIIAASLAWGHPVREVIRLYTEQGRAMFRRSPPWGVIRAKYRAESLADMFRKMFLEEDGTPARLGTARLSDRLLLTVLRNATTGSAWPLTNNPAANFNAEGPECNLNIPIWKLLRASTAAPTFFPPERIALGDQIFTFIDGAVTPYNNPGLIALLTATLPEYRVEWATGEDQIFLLSVGTGRVRATLPTKPLGRLNLIDHLLYLPPALMGSMAEHQDMLCRVLGRCVHGDAIDAELRDMKGAGVLPDDARLCSYARVNPVIKSRISLDAVHRVDELLAIGRAAGDKVVPRLS